MELGIGPGRQVPLVPGTVQDTLLPGIEGLGPGLGLERELGRRPGKTVYRTSCSSYLGIEEHRMCCRLVGMRIEPPWMHSLGMGQVVEVVADKLVEEVEVVVAVVEEEVELELELELELVQ